MRIGMEGDSARILQGQDLLAVCKPDDYTVI